MIKKKHNNLPKLFRCLKVRVSTLDEDGILFVVIRILILKINKKTNDDIINKVNIAIYLYLKIMK